MSTKRIAIAASAILAAAGAVAATAQQRPADPSPDAKRDSGASPLYRVMVVARSTSAINYGHLSGGTMIDFRGTILQPMAKGTAKVTTKRGATRVETKFEKLVPATQYGPEFLTYVLWAITPEGRATNLGELVLEGGKTKLDATAELQAFAMIVTAEPYFAVSQPGDVVVLENIVRADTVGRVEEVQAKYELLQRGQAVSVATTGGISPTLDPTIPLGLHQARNALRVAQGAGAERYAADTFRKAQELLKQAEDDQARKIGKKQVEMAAREAVQTAEDARAITAKRREDERLAQERQAAADREAKAREATAAAEKAKQEAELAANRAAKERAEAEAARAAALADVERARQEAKAAAAQRKEAEEARAAALAEQQAAQAEAERARQSAVQSERLRQQAEAEKAELRAKLLNQLNMVLQTRDSARGLIVNMSDVLFDTGSATLKPGAREKLAKISGILLGHPGLNLQVEGHTDSVGSDEMNQQLSERRAGSVRDFLVQQGVAANAVAARGFGKTQPVASNDTGEGRQQNRRVELVVTGNTIGTAVAASDSAPD